LSKKQHPLKPNLKRKKAHTKNNEELEISETPAKKYTHVIPKKNIEVKRNLPKGQLKESLRCANASERFP